MADTKLSALTALTGANLAVDDEFYVGDISVTTSKKMTAAELLIGMLSIGDSYTLGGADAAAPDAQTLKVQSVVAGTSNTAGAHFTIAGSQGTGTGVGGDIIFQVAPAGSSGSSQNALATRASIKGVAAGGYGVGSLLFNGSAANTGVFWSSTYGLRYDSVTVDASVIRFYLNSNDVIGISDSGIRLNTAVSAENHIAWGGGISNANMDLFLKRDAANTLAQRNGTTAQTHRIYNTWTDASNGEWLEFGFTSNVPYIAAKKEWYGHQ